MPSSKSTLNRSTGPDDAHHAADGVADAGATAPASAPVGGAPALPPNAPDTAPTRAVWAALTGQPGSTAATLADAAGISRSTAAKALAGLEQAGLATRTAGGREGSKRLPDEWQAVVASEPGAIEAVAAEPAESVKADGPGAAVEEQTEPEPRDEDECEPAEAVQDEAGKRAKRAAAKRTKAATSPATSAGKSRLGSGQLRDMVLNHLREHAGEEFSPGALGKILARSAGATSNACDRLQAEGAVVLTSPKPRKFRIAAAKN